MLIEVRAGLRVARSLEITLGLAAAMREPVLGRTFLVVQPFGLLTRLTKLDDVTHPELDDHRASESV